MTEWKGGQG